MAFYLSRERNGDVVAAHRRYQEYLREREGIFPSGAHDARRESVTISESAPLEEGQERITTVRVRLAGAYGDGHIELFYPRVYSYRLQSPSSERGMGDWLYDEFKLTPERHIVHEIEWAGFPEVEGSRWIIEASEIEYRWIAK